MVTQQQIDEFLKQKHIAIVGVSSRNPLKFSNYIYKHLSKLGYTLYPVNPKHGEYKGKRCYARLQDIEEPVTAAVIVTKPKNTETIVKDAQERGIKHIWMQQGASSKQAIEYAEANGINVVHGECLIMFAKPHSGLHGFHHWLWGKLGKLPG